MSASAFASGAGVHVGCAPRYTTLVRDGSTRPVAIRSCRVASLMHATCDAREMPSSTCSGEKPRGIEPRRGAFARGLERIGVVARHDGALGRQRAYEMRVAVIDDVKDVEVAAARPKPARIVPEPPRQPVAELRAAAAAHDRQPRPSPDHRWTQPRRDDVAAGDRRQHARAACRRRDPCCASLLHAGRRRRRRAQALTADWCLATASRRTTPAWRDRDQATRRGSRRHASRRTAGSGVRGALAS